VTLALGLCFDAAGERLVRDTWAILDAAGFVSLGSPPGSANVPHISLAVFDGGDAERIGAELSPLLAAAAPVAVRLSHLGCFTVPQTVLFLGVAPTEALLKLHDACWASLGRLARAPWPLYGPGSWVPHCTLAMPVSDLPAALAACAGVELPIGVRAASTTLVEVPSGTLVATLPAPGIYA
jgi:2'-5' RNA ligase